jgi:hypothetical protein
MILITSPVSAVEALTAIFIEQEEAPDNRAHFLCFLCYLLFDYNFAFANNRLRASNRMNKTAKNTKDAKEVTADFCLPWRTGGPAARDLAVQFVRCN